MDRAEWLTKMALGLACYWPVMWWPWWARTSKNKVFMWALSWAGFYAHDTGFDDWLRRKSPNLELTGDQDDAKRRFGRPR